MTHPVISYRKLIAYNKGLYGHSRQAMDTGKSHRLHDPNTGMADGEVITEIERYIVLPGQACAYKIGMMKILPCAKKQNRHSALNST